MRQRCAQVTALLLCAASIWLHLRLLRTGGPLWRDEITTLHVAAAPSWPEMAGLMEFDSFPVLPFAVLRAWAQLFGHSDAALRAFGFAVGLAVLAALWLAARTMAMAAPLLSTALVGFSGAAVRYGDSLRGYGLGMLLAVLPLAAVR